MQRTPAEARKLVAALAAALGLAAAAAEAHHSIAAVYDGAREVAVEGTVAEFRFVNPHPVLVVDVPGEAGAAQPWRLEMDNRGELAAIGVGAETFAPGDRVTAVGSPGRTEPRTLYVRRLERASDGLRYEQVGYSPRITWQRTAR